MIRHLNGMYIRSGEASRDDAFVIHENLTEHDQYGLHNVRRPKVIVDVGAHIGAFAVACRRRWPRAYIVCIEPLALNFEYLELNLKKFVHTDYQAHLAGVSPCQTVSISCPEGEKLFRQKTQPGGDIPGVSISDVWPGHIGLLKLDCEGCEEFVLADPDQLSRVDSIVAEWHDPTTWDGAIAVLEDCGFAVATLRQMTETGIFHAYRVRGESS